MVPNIREIEIAGYEGGLVLLGVSRDLRVIGASQTNVTDIESIVANPLLRTSLSSTNLIESCFARTDHWTRRVKRWRNAAMVMRWGAAALLVAEAGFRRVKGHAHLPSLKAALETHLQSQLDPQRKAA